MTSLHFNKFLHYLVLTTKKSLADEKKQGTTRKQNDGKMTGLSALLFDLPKTLWSLINSVIGDCKESMFILCEDCVGNF